MRANDQLNGDLENDADPEVLLESAVLGEQVAKFMETRIGQYLEFRAEEVVNEAVAQLKVCDPEDVKQIRELQNKIKVAESVLVWTTEIIKDGLRALEILEERG